MRKIKILFIIPDLHSGGSQRFLINLMTQLDENKFELFLFPKRCSGNFVQHVPENTQILNHENLSVLESVFVLRRVLNSLEPDFTFSVLNRTNLLNIICSKLFRFRHTVIIRESNSPLHQLKNNSIPRLQLFVGKILYHFCDIVISQTEEMREDMLSFYGLDPNKVLTIGNLIDGKNLLKMSTESTPFDESTFNIVAVGRLERQKGYDVLLNSLKLLSQTTVNFHCYICGETETDYSEHIFKLTNDLNLTNKTTFVGYTSNPYKYIANADVFILTSYFEGLPNVILEARFLRVPIVVTNTLKIYHDIISETDGIITSFDNNDIADAIIQSQKLKPKPYSNRSIKEYEKLFLCIED